MNLQNQIRYLNEILNIDMFDDCTVPDGLNMERVRGAIVMRCGLLTPLFSEPEVQRNATQQFFFENQWNFQHIINILKAEYSPIENVAEWRDESQTGTTEHVTERKRENLEEHSGTDSRRIEEDGTTVDTESGTTRIAEGGTTQQAESGTTQQAESGTTTITEGGTTRNAESGNTAVAEGGATTTTHEVSAENATTYQADRKETVNHGKTDTTTHGKTDTTTHGKTESTAHGKTDTTTHGKTDTTTHGKTDTTTHGKVDTVDEDKVTTDDLTHGENVTRTESETITDTDSGDRGLTMHRHGNVGVTTNQQMINEELDLLERFNPYKFIADLYEKELILGLY